MKTEKRKSLQGSVLFTVVCVMALLIIFLTGTLALASASSNRAHKSYSSSQASYTARAAIESFTQAMARDPGLPAAIENMTTDPLYPEVIINDKSLGQIGYYFTNAAGKQEWVPNHIEIVPVDTGKKDYIYTDPKKDGNWKWVEVTTVRITATCRVGKEEETVSAYVRKMPSGSSKTEPGGLDGLQEVGGNAFPNGALITGGLGVGISKDNTGMYSMHNNTSVETKISFINGSLATGTGSSNFYVKAPTDTSKKPYSQTIIMGNLWLRNSNFMNVNYDMDSNYTQKEVPYLYIDGTVGASQNGTVNLVQGDGKGPYNVFIGTLDVRKKDGSVKYGIDFGNADVYLMDDYSDTDYIKLKYPGDANQRDFSAEEMTDETDPRSDSLKAQDQIIYKGHNYLGSNDLGCNLYSWTSSYINKTDSQFVSNGGGNLYVKGDLTIQKMKIAGDLRVDRNCYLGKDVVVGGKIVVKGELHITDSSFSAWDKVYCNNVFADGDMTYEADVVKDGYVEHTDEVLPGYKEVRNFVYNNTELPEDKYELRKAFQDPADGWRWHIRLPGDDETGSRVTEQNDGWGDNGRVDGVKFEDYGIYVVTDDELATEGSKWGKTVPYYVTNAYGENINTVTFDDKTIYKANPDNPSVVYVDDTGNNERTSEEYMYYKVDDEGNVLEEVDKDTAKHTYYTKVGESTPVSRDEAVGKETKTFHTYEEAGYAYPPKMTREAILGEDSDTEGFIVHPETKIVKNIYEMRSDLNLTSSGDYDPAVYFTSVPDEFCIDTPEGEDYMENRLPYAFNDDGTKFAGNETYYSPWSGDTITKSCIIGKSDGTEFKMPKQIKIKSTDVIWVVLRNVKFDEDDGNNMMLHSAMNGKQIVCDTSEGKVRFLIDGTLTIGKGAIIKDGFKNGQPVDAKSSWGIEYYGTEGSKIKCINNVTLIGTFMCPLTSYSGNVAGAFTVKYKDVYGVERELNEPIIGSAMFDHVEEAVNNFGVINSGGSATGIDPVTVETVFGTYEISYFMGV